MHLIPARIHNAARASAGGGGGGSGGGGSRRRRQCRAAPAAVFQSSCRCSQSNAVLPGASTQRQGAPPPPHARTWLSSVLSGLRSTAICTLCTRRACMGVGGRHAVPRWLAWPLGLLAQAAAPLYAIAPDRHCPRRMWSSTCSAPSRTHLRFSPLRLSPRLSGAPAALPPPRAAVAGAVQRIAAIGASALQALHQRPERQQSRRRQSLPVLAMSSAGAWHCNSAGLF